MLLLELAVKKKIIIIIMKLHDRDGLFFGSCFETIHNVSASQLEVLVTWCFSLQEMPM